MQIHRVNHCKIGQRFQGQEAILFFHYAGSSFLNMLRKNSCFLRGKQEVNRSEWECLYRIAIFGEMLLETFVAPGGMGAGTTWAVPEASLGWMTQGFI